MVVRRILNLSLACLLVSLVVALVLTCLIEALSLFMPFKVGFWLLFGILSSLTLIYLAGKMLIVRIFYFNGKFYEEFGKQNANGVPADQIFKATCDVLKIPKRLRTEDSERRVLIRYLNRIIQQ